MVELLTEFQPIEMVQLICLEPRPGTGGKSRIKFPPLALVLRISSWPLVSYGYETAEIPQASSGLASDWWGGTRMVASGFSLKILSISVSFPKEPQTGPLRLSGLLWRSKNVNTWARKLKFFKTGFSKKKKKSLHFYRICGQWQTAMSQFSGKCFGDLRFWR